MSSQLKDWLCFQVCCANRFLHVRLCLFIPLHTFSWAFLSTLFRVCGGRREFVVAAGGSNSARDTHLFSDTWAGRPTGWWPQKTGISALMSTVVYKPGHVKLKRVDYIFWVLQSCCHEVSGIYAAAFYLNHNHHFISGSRNPKTEIQACFKLQLEFNSDACRARTVTDEGFSLLLSSPSPGNFMGELLGNSEQGPSRKQNEAIIENIEQLFTALNFTTAK